MEKIQIYLGKEELDALRKAAARSGRSVAELVRDAIRKVVLKSPVRFLSGTASQSVRLSNTIASTTSRDATRRGGFRRQRGVDQDLSLRLIDNIDIMISN